MAASNWPRASWDWEEPERGTGPTCAADTWAPPPSSEAPRTAPSSATDGSAGNGKAGRPAAPSSAPAAAAGRDHDVVLVGSGGGGLRCGRGRPGCRSHRCRHKCGFGVVGFGWPPLAVVPVLVPCTLVPLADSIRSKFVSNRAANEFRVPLRTRSSMILTEIAADRVIGWPRLVDRRGARGCCCFPLVPLTFNQQLIDAPSSRKLGSFPLQRSQHVQLRVG